MQQSSSIANPHHEHHAAHPAGNGEKGTGSPSRLALVATLHCLTGCSLGEILGMVVATHLGLGNAPSVAVATGLAFLFGYAFTLVPLVRSGMSWRRAILLALASDTASIAVMEVADNATMLLIPGAMDATLRDGLFWVAMSASLVVAGVAAFPVNRWLIERGRGHAVVHGAHH